MNLFGFYGYISFFLGGGGVGVMDLTVFFWASLAVSFGMGKI